MICVMVGIDDLADGFLCHPANCTLERLGHGFDIQCVNDKAGVISNLPVRHLKC